MLSSTKRGLFRWVICRNEDSTQYRCGAQAANDLGGGLELPPKVVQEGLGHSTIALTLDIYGHLFPWHDESEELAARSAPSWAEGIWSLIY
jgi:hypothetical protein